MVGEVFAGIGAFKTMFDMAKALKDIDNATHRNAAVIELQERILAAREEQSALSERIRALEAEVAGFEKWDAEKQRYVLNDAGNGALAYMLKADAQPPEHPHSICPDCYQRRIKSILQQVIRMPNRSDVLMCQTCGWEAYLTGSWRQEHGSTKSASHRR